MKFEKETPWGIAYGLSKRGCDWVEFSSIDSGYNEYGGSTEHKCLVKFLDDEIKIIETQIIEDAPDWGQAEYYEYNSYYLNEKRITESESLEYMKAVQQHFDRSNKIDKVVK